MVEATPTPRVVVCRREPAAPQPAEAAASRVVVVRTSPPTAPPAPARDLAAAGAASIDPEDLDCIVCFKLLYEPVTLHCGHAFCRSCVAAAAAAEAPRPPRCLVCRAQLPAGTPPAAPSLLLASLLQRLAPVEYARRREELALEAAAAAAAAAARDAATAPATLHLLIFSPPLLPGQRLRLRLQEPRLLRLAHALFQLPPPQRIALADRPPAVDSVLTEADVISIAPLRGGAVLLVLRGRRRVTLLAPAVTGEDGVPSVEVGAAADAAPADAAAAAELAALTAELRRCAGDWAARVRTGGFERMPGQLDAVLAELGPHPVLDDPASAEALSLWAAALINPLPALAVAPDIRVAALRGRDTRQRLLLVAEAMGASMATMGATSRAATALAAAAQQVGALAEGAARAGGLIARLWRSRGDTTLAAAAGAAVAGAAVAGAGAGGAQQGAASLGLMPRGSSVEAEEAAPAPATLSEALQLAEATTSEPQ